MKTVVTSFLNNPETQGEDPVNVNDMDHDRSQLATSMLVNQRRKRRSRTRNVWTLRVVTLALVLGLWELSARLDWISPRLTSMPSEIWSAFGYYFTEGDIWGHIWATSLASALGMLLGSVLGILSGVVLGKSATLARAFNPFVTTLNALPRVALAPIFLVWFGLGLTPKVLVGASIVYFVLLVNTVAGLQNVDDDISFLSRVLAMSPLQKFRYVDLPTALPSISAGLRLGAVYSVLGVIVSEMVASQSGLGQVLVTATANLQMDRAFAVIAVITAVSTVLDFVISLLDKQVRRKQVASSA